MRFTALAAFDNALPLARLVGAEKPTVVLNQWARITLRRAPRAIQRLVMSQLG